MIEYLYLIVFWLAVKVLVIAYVWIFWKLYEPELWYVRLSDR